ncbi:type II secretion system F family protein [Prosthecochloris sp. N3]|uniref:Type II secretion system F family protein n=1 Tax=Prosthecochloris ethylica TaxID=2743976 RepID=A0ABR9XPU3_9CHLB|nr:type II secretion system F family protein [Prosthecochloris ethylica]MBF0586288.1 type II secretion system F family protein [Prosthecochloris ethylica]MBF0635994.1 type II secretion system F family protein [Prosthecochloris ethylica]NUK47331.1 type II secretion system F family protein [Prosthecochloris ethylica]
MQNSLQILIITLSGAAVTSLVLALYNLVFDNARKNRFTQILRQSWSPSGTRLSRTSNPQKVSNVINILSRLSLPQEGWQSSNVQVKFLQAGIRHKNAPQYYFAVKTLLTLVLPVALALFLMFTQPHIPFTHTMLLVLLTATAGYYLPELSLHVLTRKRIDRMRNSLPDMIDLMVVCSESGMGIDAAITRISHEMARTNPDLAQEFYLSALEMRAGATRIEALRNLALRARLDDLNDLVSMLVQADKFGTSLAESLRVQSDVMRSRRIQRAEELAAKIPVKLVLPLGLFIFPTLLLVLLGPAVIKLILISSR